VINDAESFRKNFEVNGNIGFTGYTESSIRRRCAEEFIAYTGVKEEVASEEKFKKLAVEVTQLMEDCREEAKSTGNVVRK
jgi:hypothetical protein